MSSNSVSGLPMHGSELMLASKQEWDKFKVQKAILNPVLEKTIEEQFALLEEFGNLQVPRCRPPIQDMDIHDLRWVPFHENKVTLSNHVEMSASEIYVELGYDRFIASQAPFSCNIHHFWQMVWEKDVDQIVMLTELCEGTIALCGRYWPESKDHSLHLSNDIEIMLIEESCILPEKSEHILVRKFRVSWKGQEKHVTHYWYRNWPDKTAPTQSETLLTLIKAVQEDKSKNNSNAPILVHCVAGVGRTGVFTAVAHTAQRRARKGESLNLIDLVACLRWQRIKLVARLVQYQFCHDTIHAI